MRRAFTLGTTYIAEVDIVLPEDMPLKEAHDIGEGMSSSCWWWQAWWWWWWQGGGVQARVHQARP